MESQRNLMLIALLFVSFLLWQQWNIDQNPQLANNEVATSSHQGHIHDVPTSDGTMPEEQLTQSTNLIHVKTDQLDIKISPIGGDIVNADLVSHKKELDGDDSFVLLEQAPDFTYISQSGLIGKDGIDTVEGRAVYTSEKQEYRLAEGEDQLSIPLTYTADNGVTYVKTFTFTKGKFDVGVDYTINNTSDNPLYVQMYGQIKQTMKEAKKSLTMMSYRGAAYSTSETRYQKYTFSDITDNDLKEETVGGWAAMLQHYFVSAWVPPADNNNIIFSSTSANGLANIGFRGEPQTIAAGSEKVIHATFYVGPKDQAALSELSDTLNLVVDYGFLWWLAVPIYKLMIFFQSFVGNWGLAIILITLTVRGVLYPLTKAQYTSMAKMRNLQPKLQLLKERCGEDKQKMGQEMMALYKKEKVNPLGGCFPILLQMPIFIALYWVLQESVELRHSPFILWINDLSVKDPYFILPILMGLSMFVMQKMQPMSPTMDPMQQKIMQYMPVVMTVFFLWFPAGLVLYWLFSNIVAIIQQKIIYAKLEKSGLK